MIPHCRFGCCLSHHTTLHPPKQAGFNAVRCSHYPNHDRWYEICSLFGLYVVDEVNLETHGFDPTFSNNETNPACQPEWLPAILDRAVRMHARSVRVRFVT